MIGTIKNLVQDRGFGFIRDAASGQDYFFHRSECTNGDFSMMKVGDSVHFDAEVSKKGPRAVNVQKMR